VTVGTAIVKELQQTCAERDGVVAESDGAIYSPGKLAVSDEDGRDL
jgi:hypothetical protein